MTETLGRISPLEPDAESANSSRIPNIRPLDVLIVTSEAPPIISGISTCIGKLKSGLTDRGHNVVVLSSVQIPRVAFGEFRFSSFVAYWPKIAQMLRNFDVVNVHGPVPTMSDAFLRLANRLPAHARPAIVYTHHSPIDVRGASWMSARYNKIHESLALRADRIVTSSQHYASQHRSRYGPLVRAIPWGVDVRTSPPSGDRDIDEKLRVLFVGQMRSYKGVERLLTAVGRQPWAELTLVGNGSELARYQRLAERVAPTNTRFTGRLSDMALQREYEAHDVVVLPSVTHAEAFGLVLLEGMAAGCVPVASDLPGVRDVAGPTGLLVPPGDPLALREALRGLSSDVTRLKELQLASWMAAQTLSWERCVTDYEEVMFEAARSRYARLHGMAILPDLESRAAGPLPDNRFEVPQMRVSSDEQGH